MASSSSSLAPPLAPRFHVFLSFISKDTRNNFTDHLHAALLRKGINTFIDNKLNRGEQILPALLEAIEGSRFSIVILSENYASSRWCLDELVKILDCKKAMKQVVLPIFYNVDPTEVGKQTGSFAKAFAKHDDDFKDEKEKVQKWRIALTEAATISGWNSQNRSESMLIEEIVKFISNKLISISSSVAKGLVGMDSRIEEMNSLLCTGLGDVLIVGICGLGGIGKTTIADAVYNQISGQFEGRCFLEKVKEDSKRHGLVHLQKQLLSKILMEENMNIDTLYIGINVIKDRLCSRKVLIVLDDVDNMGQLEALAGKRDWFGSGSRIIITTRDEQLLIAHQVEKRYKPKELDNDESIQLLNQKAFKGKHPQEDYVKLSKAVINYAKGLPLALNVLGSFLCGRCIDVWESALKKLKESPNREIQEILKISYDGLDNLEQDLFLDIACFFKGDDKDYITKVLDSCNLFPHIGLSVLTEKSLITILDNMVLMHDLLQEMGREIVRQGSRKDPGKRSRLWSRVDVYSVLMSNSGTDVVEGIILDLSGVKEVNFSTKAFATMNKLRLLKICNVHHPGGFEYLSKKELSLRINARPDAYERMNALDELLMDSKVHLSGGFEFLSNELRCFYWHGFPLKSWPSNFHPENLVELNICYSHVKHLWNGIKVLEKLTFIKLSHSQYLTKTPDFTGTPNLERLILEGCTGLVEVHPSTGDLNKLVFLNLKDCKNLSSLPSSIALKSLEILILSGCSKLGKFPEIRGNMKHLSELFLDGTAIKELPLSIEHLIGLILLDLRNCRKLRSLPSSIFKLKSLEILTLSGCSKLESFPKILENMECLRKLHLDGTNIKELPLSIDCLNGLVLLNLRDCKNLSSLPDSICKLKFLGILTLSGCSKLDKLPENLGNLQCLAELNANGIAIEKLPSSIVLLKNLKVLSLGRCGGPLSNLWSSPFSFWSLPRRSSNSMNMLLPSFSGLRSLTQLDLSGRNLLDEAIPSDLDCLSSLRTLDLSGNNFLSIPIRISQLSQLRYLNLEFCKRLEALPELPSSIEEVQAHDCTSLKTFSSPSSLCTSNVFEFNFTNCFKLAENLWSILEANFQRLLQGSSNLCMATNIVHPGSGISRWFSHQSIGSSVVLQLPPHWYNSKFKGWAVCAIFAFKDVIRNHPGSIYCSLISNDGHYISSFGTYTNLKFEDEDRFVQSDHVWMSYLPFSPSKHSELKPDKLNNWSHIKASFKIPGPPSEVKKCGIHLIYEHNEDDNDQKMIEYISSSENPGQFHEESVEKEDTTHKRSCDEVVEQSGSGSSGEELPKPERLRGPVESILKLKGKCIQE